MLEDKTRIPSVVSLPMVLGKTYKPFPSSQFLKFQENGASASMQEGGHDFLCLHSEMQNCPPVCDYKDLLSPRLHSGLSKVLSEFCGDC